MKQVVIIIRPNMYYATKEKLDEKRFFAMSTKEVLGRGKRGTHFMTIDGQELDHELDDSMVAKKMIEIFVRDEDVDRLIETVLEVNHNNKFGDGKIFVLPTEDCIRIHTGEKGDNALV